MFKKTIISLFLAGSFILLPSCVSNNTTTKKNPQFTPRRDYSQSSSSSSLKNNTKEKADTSIQTGKRPAWVDGKSVQFASHTYLTAVGYGKTRKQAENNARAEMSQIFNTKIKAVNESVQNFSVSKENRKVKFSSMEYTATKKIKNETEAIFAGLQLSRYWKDKKGTIYVLGTINKTKVLPPLKEKMRKFDDIIQTLVEEAKSSNDKLSKIEKLNKAIKKAIHREYYNAQVAIMSSRGQTVKTNYDLEMIIHLLNTELDKINISVSVSGEGNKSIKYAIIQALSNMNLKTNGETVKVDLDEFEDFSEDTASTKATTNSNVDLEIIGEVSFKALDRGGDYKWVTGKVTLAIKNKNTNKIITTFIIDNKIRRVTLQDARRMAGKKLIKKLISELEVKLINKIGSSDK